MLSLFFETLLFANNMRGKIWQARMDQRTNTADPESILYNL